MECLGHVRVHPWCVCGGLPAGMGKLHTDESTLRMREVHDALERLHLAVSPESLPTTISSRHEETNHGSRSPRPAEKYDLQGRLRLPPCRLRPRHEWRNPVGDAQALVSLERSSRPTPTCTKCQSVACPLSELYWHIGDCIDWRESWMLTMQCAGGQTYHEDPVLERHASNGDGLE